MRASARKAIMRGVDDILVIFADTPLMRAETLLKLRAALSEGAAVAVLGFNAADPSGYGRLLTRGDDLLAIREHSDATPEERKVGFCNGGLMALSGGMRWRSSSASETPMPKASIISATRLPSPAIWA